MTSSLRSFDHSVVEWQNQRAALIITHPGHELFVHGWLEKARPLVFVLVDAPGSGGWPLHLHSTARVLRSAGARIGRLFGRFTNQALYRTIRGGGHERFLAVAEEISEELERERIDYVVGDAAEGYDIGHDACRLIIDAAVSQAAHRRPSIRNYELVLNSPHSTCPPDLHQQSLWVHLDADSWPRKHAAACGYPELAGEIDLAAERFGLDSLRVECLRPAMPSSAIRSASRETLASEPSLRGQFLPLVERLRIGSAPGRRVAA